MMNTIEIDVCEKSVKSIITSAKQYGWYLRFKRYPFLRWLVPLTYKWTMITRDTQLKIIDGDVKLLKKLGIMNKGE